MTRGAKGRMLDGWRRKVSQRETGTARLEVAARAHARWATHPGRQRVNVAPSRTANSGQPPHVCVPLFAARTPPIIAEGIGNGGQIDGRHPRRTGRRAAGAQARFGADTRTRRWSSVRRQRGPTRPRHSCRGGDFPW